MVPVLCYLFILLGVSWYVGTLQKGRSFVTEYFLADRSLGGFVLGMTLIATFTSASSFLGGPGVAYSTGLSWVLLAMIQVPTGFFTLGILGKKFAVISRRINSVTVTDFLYQRYRSNAVVIGSSIAIIAFFIAMMVAQFKGGAVLFESLTGFSYEVGLIIFGLVVVFYTAIGGFRAVVLTDAIQAVVMVIATVTILITVLLKGGGSTALVDVIAAENPLMLDANATARPTILSYWVLVGIGLLGLPQNTVRAMSYKDTDSLHKAMIYGTVVVGFLMLGMHLAGFYAQGVLEGVPANSDAVIPMMVMQLLPGFWSGLFLAGPLAAIMSTVSSLLILASAAICKDLILHFHPRKSPSDSNIRAISIAATAVIGALTFLFALDPPNLIVWINLFAMGGLEAAFFWPTVLGLFWKRANATGALCSMIGGVGTYVAMGQFGINIMGINNVCFGLLAGLVCFIIGSLATKKPDKEVLLTFFGEEA
ncbi:MAG: sodium/pantothenate symporter [Firmicutes bacterium]|nr:sodium/pantothenate symporter [Bacillota bacterium]